MFCDAFSSQSPVFSSKSMLKVIAETDVAQDDTWICALRVFSEPLRTSTQLASNSRPPPAVQITARMCVTVVCTGGPLLRFFGAVSRVAQSFLLFEKLLRTVSAETRISVCRVMHVRTCATNSHVLL